ncbi:MAG: WbqC family protein [Paludibacteraceae bacterium]|nr:WbqC family protein [Paludibacteraceae bacterium]
MILPTTYMGPVEWYRQFLTNPSAVQIEVMESFPKQTYRNRCTIATPDGPLTFTVPVKRVDSKQLTRDVEISYQQRWQHQHWIALVSAYKRTPYFDYYADFFRPFYEQETRFLVDFNEKIHEVIIRLIANDEPRIKSQEQRLITTADWAGQDLEQAFGNGQSILDILFEYGPESVMKI